MKSFFLFISLFSVSVAVAAPCEVNTSGCKAGAGWIATGGKKLTDCQWMAELGRTLDQLQTVGACQASPKTCELKSSGCKAGAAWIATDGKQLTACEWMDDLIKSYTIAVEGGICHYSTQACEYQTTSACKTGAGKIVVGTETLTACEWLADAAGIMKRLRRSGACL